MAKLITYKEKDCFIHRLSGLTKLIFFLLWTLTAMLTYDTRVLVLMVLISLVVFKLSRTELRQVKNVFGALLFFLTVNLLAIFFFSPYEGCKIYESRTDLLKLFGPYTITAQQLFYEGNILLKYLSIVPSVFMFVTATNPSEFAASLNKIGIPYTISYSVALALRYIPDVQNDFTKIKNAQQARGIEMSRKAGLVKRILGMSAILFPLIFTSMERIDVVTNAMELRGFGKNKKRTWYSERSLAVADKIVIAATVVFVIVCLFITYKDKSRFYNPF